MGFTNTVQIVRRPEVAVAPMMSEQLHPVLARIYASRGVASADELDYSLSRLDSYHALKGIEAAVALLQRALDKKWRILIIGDFDADGATSTAVAVRALKMMGAHHVDFLVPNRFEYGYGLTPEIVAVARKRNPDLIVTVDNGISSISGVAAAKAAGIHVLVTDHHLPAKTLPAADAIVNPNQPDDAFPNKSLAGVGVIFYVMLALRSSLRDSGWLRQHGLADPNLASLLDLVALGTVADVVPLERDNRILVSQGLARIRSNECSAGISAILEIAGRNREKTVSSDLGFAVGPRLNAAGRLHDMSIGIRCLLSDDLTTARQLAAELDALNRQRREIEGNMQSQAMAALQALVLEAQPPKGVCLYDPSWHEGVIGILASRIKERVHRPVIVFTASGDKLIKGSARSIPGLHIRDTLDAVAAHHPGLISKFGGHAMAAGMTLPLENYELFRNAFIAEVDRQLRDEDLQATLLSDGELAADEAIDFELARQLRYGGPWGQGFSAPLFDGVFELVHQRVVGEKHLKMVLRWPGTRHTVDAIYFNAPDDCVVNEMSRLCVAYRLDINEYRGQQSIQLIIEHMERDEMSRNG